MKKRNYVTGLIIIALCACLLWLFLGRGTKPTALRYVKEHVSELESFAARMIQNGDTEATYQDWDVSHWENTDMVEFIVEARGIVPASSYQGFYYSPHDKPLGFQGVEVTLYETDTGWAWEGTGDNSGYTEKIMENWYWFEAEL